MLDPDCYLSKMKMSCNNRQASRLDGTKGRWGFSSINFTHSERRESELLPDTSEETEAIKETLLSTE